MNIEFDSEPVDGDKQIHQEKNNVYGDEINTIF